MEKITHVDVRMYGTGTGDCFTLKFFSDKEEVFTMMVDGGTWKGTKTHLSKYVKDLKKYVNNKLDLLVITHEHKDHVYLFDACSHLFTDDFEIDQVWMSWSENEADELVKEWKDQYGKKKRALALAADKVQKTFTKGSLSRYFKDGFNARGARKELENFPEALDSFLDLHFSARSGEYSGGLKGMEIIKNELNTGSFRYLRPGQIETVKKLPGVKFNILGPPQSIRSIKKEHGKKGSEDTYDHNKILQKSDSFSAAVSGSASENEISPFGGHFENEEARNYYEKDDQAWRNIDHDWLMNGSGSLALRLTTGINNLSLAMAIEFEDTGKVMLFPGDAEFGSWESWHSINWNKKGPNDIHFTEDLLNRTVFYKVAHHLSHNGTAKEKGLDMMISPDLVSMATLDMNAISSGWTSTMPNRGILKDLLAKTKGRLIVMNEEGLYYDFDGKMPLKDKIREERTQMNSAEKEEFEESYEEQKRGLYKQYRLRLSSL